MDAASTNSSPWVPVGAELAASDWNRILGRLNVPSLLVAIDARIGPSLRASCDAEDVWQETLRRAWASRGSFTWRGLAAFRKWLLLVSEHAIRDLVDTQGAQKRGGGRSPGSLPGRQAVNSTDGHESYAGPVASTTPSRVAADREQAAVLADAMEGLPEDLRGVVRLRVLDALSIEEVADRVGLGVSGVRHRVRKGLELLSVRLKARFGASKG